MCGEKRAVIKRRSSWKQPLLPCDVLTVVIFMEIESGCRNVYAGSWVFSRRSPLRYRRKVLLSTAHHLGNVSYSRVISPGSGVVQT